MNPKLTRGLSCFKVAVRHLNSFPHRTHQVARSSISGVGLFTCVFGKRSAVCQIETT